MNRLDLLLTQTDEVYSRLSARLRGLTDEEYFWQPVPDCWTVRRVGDRWVADYEADAPDPPPFTTIAWALAHLTQGKAVFHDWAFGGRSMAFADVVPAPTAAGAVADLDRAHATLRGAIAGLSDAELDGEVPTVLGERWPTWQIASRFLDHDAHHGAEIALLRDLYRASRAAPDRTDARLRVPTG